MNFSTEHNEVTNEMVCTYSKEYKSITNKSTGDTKFYFNDEIIIDEKGVSVVRFCELQKKIYIRASKLKLKS